AADREARRAVPLHGLSGPVLQQVLGAAHVVEQLGAAELRAALVTVAVAGELVSLGHDAPHKVRIALGDPPQGEERAPRAARGEESEQAFDIALDPALAPVPGRAVDVGRE